MEEKNIIKADVRKNEIAESMKNCDIEETRRKIKKEIARLQALKGERIEDDLICTMKPKFIRMKNLPIYVKRKGY